MRCEEERAAAERRKQLEAEERRQAAAAAWDAKREKEAADDRWEAAVLAALPPVHVAEQLRMAARARREAEQSAESADEVGAWKMFDLNQQYECSAQGQVRRVGEKEPMQGTEVKGEIMLTLSSDNKKKISVRRANIIAWCWAKDGKKLALGPGGAVKCADGKMSKYKVYHQKDTKNDCARNLLILTKQEARRRGLD
ncbi:hypothetical protein CHLRE_04g217968v5 [Chlamydomonas reinhardtii]|uniref:Uncharacterized protein n=1 Tax=Chlamydomonas reinhardtii TaxID=3055 RepID=A0A2K3DTK3_CHLRE|nr:uncharacterized protein CHLRE_04g217968v5 [Chlamydomonas reinhardtii]PNW83870.1 hypothetical protein CHLRE_04g217968v5 [Chlamydomonas reinhardtii]